MIKLNYERGSVKPNERYGYLVVVAKSNKRDRGNAPLYECTCDCGKTTYTTTYRLRSQKTRSCGCLGATNRAAANTKHGHASRGKWSTTYKAWMTMKRRCRSNVPKVRKAYKDKGIDICDRWSDYNSFLKDVGEAPTPKHTLDRIDNSKGYFPGNVRWATRIEQARNTTRNRLLTYKGKTQCASAWAEELGIHKGTIATRLRLGWSVEETLSTPINPNLRNTKAKLYGS